MKYIFLFLMAGTLWSCNSNDAQSTAGAPTTGDKAGDHAVAPESVSDSANFTTVQWIDSTHRDLGKLNEGGTVDISWKVKNTGTKPLVIADVMAGCGCTVAEKPGAPIAPGEEGTIKAQFNSKGQTGTQNKTVTVKANTKEQAYYLTFSAEVAPK